MIGASKVVFTLRQAASLAANVRLATLIISIPIHGQLLEHIMDVSTSRLTHKGNRLCLLRL